MTLTAFVAALASAAHQHTDLEDDNQRLDRFGEFLRRGRLGIPAETKSLGNFSRLPNRVGKLVSQEEFAEAIGVSRCWYGMLEAGRRVRPSIALMDRICDALMLDERQRLQLVELGLPALSQLLSKTIPGQSSEAA
jgi:DNA-binding XRE family transcriptional regulator